MSGSAGTAAVRTRVAWVLPLQVLVMVALLVLAAAPPARGMMLVVPVGGSATVALAGGARFVSGGPLPGTIVVNGDRATLLPHLLRHGAIAVATRSAACGRAAA